MKLIELHNGGLRYSLNADFITGVASLDEGGCSVWVLGVPDDRPNICDESYEDVIRLIQESERGTGGSGISITKCTNCAWENPVGSFICGKCGRPLWKEGERP